MISTILAGIFLILMGLCHFGSLIKFIPYTITTGFTSGIAVTIVIGQLKDFFGVTYPNGLKPIETMEKLNAFALGFSSFHVDALIVGGVSLAILIISPYIFKRNSWIIDRCGHWYSYGKNFCHSMFQRLETSIRSQMICHHSIYLQSNFLW